MRRNNKFGNRFTVNDYTGRIQAAFHLPDFVRQIADCPALLNNPATMILHQGRNRIGAVCLESPVQKSVEIVIKEFNLRGLTRWKTLGFPSKAAKAWQGGNLLQAAGLTTPAPVAYLEKRRRGIITACFYISLRAERGQEIRGLFLSLPAHKLVLLLPQLAGFLAACHTAGILHRDLSDGNILVEQSKEDHFKFCLLDTNRIRARKRLNILQKIKNLIRLGVPPEHQRLFLARYLDRKDVPLGIWSWYRLNKKTFSGYIGLKKRLRLKKLAEKLRLQ